MLLFSCTEREAVREEIPIPLTDDSSSIFEKGELLVLTEYSSNSYFLYKGTPVGYDYEMLGRFCKDHDLNLKIKVIDDLNLMFEELDKGNGDLIACNLTVTEDRQRFVSFTDSLMTSNQVLVQRKPKDWWLKSRDELNELMVTDISQLEGKVIGVHEYSTFYDTALKLEKEYGIDIQIEKIKGDINSEELIQLVKNGDISYTISDGNTSALNASYYPELDVSLKLSQDETIAWALRKRSDSLLSLLNVWLSDSKNKKDNAYLHNKYFKFKKNLKSKVNSQYSSLKGNKISPFDDLILKASKNSSFDWLFLTAVVKKESNFDPETKSWAGALGLMQIMPETYLGAGGDTTDLIHGNITHGVRILENLRSYWVEKLGITEELPNFVLASYNSGLGHVIDAQVIAESQGLDPKVWRDNVEQGMRLKVKKEFYRLPGVKHGYCRGGDVVDYVDDVLTYYDHYKNVDYVY